MKRLVTAIALIITANFFQVWAQDEVMLGQYHFNDATHYWEVGEDNVIQMNEYFSLRRWLVSINEGNSGVFKAISGAPPLNTNLNHYPLSVNIEPRSEYAVVITRIEISHRTILTGDSPLQRFAYNINTSDAVTESTYIKSKYTFTDGVVDGYVGLGFKFNHPLNITGSKLYFYNRIKALEGFTSSTEIDFIKFYGTFLRL